MTEPNVSTPPQPIDIDSLRSRIAELRNVYELSEEEEEDKLMNDVKHQLEGNISRIFSECYLDLSSLPNEDLNELSWRLKKELAEVEGENAKIEYDIEERERRCVEDYDKYESELERLSCSLEFIVTQNPEKAENDMQIEVSWLAHDKSDFSNSHGIKFKMLELSHQIEKNKTILKSLQDLDSTLKRFEAVEKIEDALTGLRVLEIEGNSIRLSLKTYIPYLENVLRQQDIEGIIEPLELNHELIIGTAEGTWELKNVEIFPNDVYISDIIDAAKAFSASRQLYPAFSVIETWSPLEWFVRRVQDRIALSSIRRFVVKNANKSRHSFEYVDRKEIIVAHVVGGVDAFIKLPQGWPYSDLALELISLKSTSHDSKEISLIFLCKIVELANSLNPNVRRKISSFADNIEEILMHEMRADLHSSGTTSK